MYMLLLEEKVRMSDAYIQECTLVKDEVNGWLRVSEYVQQENIEPIQLLTTKDMCGFSCIKKGLLHCALECSIGAANTSIVLAS